MSLDICPDCGLSICDSDGSCGCVGRNKGVFRVTFEHANKSIRRRFFDTYDEAETAMNRFEDTCDPCGTGCFVEVLENGVWFPHCGEISF